MSDPQTSFPHSAAPHPAAPHHTTDVPARLDRLPWSGFHTLVVVALGITWILDGLEVTLAGSVAGALKDSPSLHLTDSEIGLAASIYLAGAVLGAVLFGWLTDRLGRKRLFFVTLVLYLAATAATGFSWNFWSFVAFRFLTGAGIGGEYTAINSTIQELIPARFRGWTDLVINGSFWVGAAIGAAGSIILLAPGTVGPDMGWRLAFGIGAVLGLVILLLRRHLPESPRWLMTHGRIAEAEAVMAEIERRVGMGRMAAPAARIRLRAEPARFGEMARAIFLENPRRVILGLSLMAAQAFFYNAIFFTYALVLGQFYAVPGDRVGWYILPFALGNVLGPILLGRLFDTIGRVPMIAFTYATSGILLAATGFAFQAGWLDATTQTIAWSVIFFFASAAASSAYLTVSETFPLEVRALAIALFYAVGTGLGGIAGPLLFGSLIQTADRGAILIGYLIGAGLMIAAAVVELVLGVRAERRPLEQVAPPITAS